MGDVHCELQFMSEWYLDILKVMVLCAIEADTVHDSDHFKDVWAAMRRLAAHQRFPTRYLAHTDGGLLF